MKPDRIYLSTIAANAPDAARECGFGLEIAEYCTAWNMDDRFESTHNSVLKKLQGIQSCLLHAPFNELFPCAIDLKVRELTALRFGQAIGIADLYGAKKIVVHSGYYERMYYPQWFVRASSFGGSLCRMPPMGLRFVWRMCLSSHRICSLI